MTSLSDAIALWQQGNLPEAEQACRILLTADPRNAGAWHTLGLVALSRGDYPTASEYLTRAVELQGKNAPLWCDLGTAWALWGRPDRATECFRQAIVVDPQFVGAWCNLGNALKAGGQFADAQSAYERAISLAKGLADGPAASPEMEQALVDSLYNLANLLRDLGRYAEAVEHYRRASALDPHRVVVLMNLASSLQMDRRHDEAIAVYRKVVEVEAGAAEAHFNLGLLLAEREELEEARGLVDRAARLRPDRPLWGMRTASFCPAIFQTEQELDDYRRELEEKLDSYRHVPLRFADEDALARDAFAPSFHLTHHGRNNRPLMEKFSALYAPHIRRREARRNTGKPRVGFLVTSPHESGFLRTMGGVVERLDPARFQTVLFCPERSIPSCRGVLRRDSIEWVPLAGRFSQAASDVETSRCDILYFHKVGADPLGYLLPFARLAPVQCTSWSTHLTSGVAELDYYVSSRWIEVPQSDVQYTERLVRLESFPIFESRPTPIRPATRAEFGLPERGALYACPQRLAKFHPAEDSLLAAVLDADPTGSLVLVGGAEREAALQPLLRRFARTLGSAAKRVVVVPPCSHADFRRMLSVCDVFLDLKHYGAALMAYDAISVNLPMVTLPGSLKVERYGQAFSSRMGVTSTVANSDKEYVDLAARMAQRGDFRQAILRDLAGASSVHFEDDRVVREYERFFEEALASSRRR